MKLIISTLITMSFSFTAMATEVLTVASVTGYEQGLKEVSLLTNNTLKVVDTKNQVSVITLTDAVGSKMIDTAIDLTNVKLIIKNSVVVCLMISPPTLSNLSVANYDFEKQTFSADQTLVLTSLGCQYANTVVPEQRYSLSSAEQLRAQMVILALNSLK